MANLPTLEGELVRPYKFGRPSKLTVELLTKARQYVEDADNMSSTTLLPTKERLARILGIDRDTLKEWAKENDDFSAICKDLDVIQADKLVQNGLVGRYTPAITAIMLSKHGYVRQEQVDNNIQMVQPIIDLPKLKAIDQDTDALSGNDSD
jgi:hypothetical protein